MSMSGWRPSEVSKPGGFLADDVVDVVQDQDERLVGARDQLCNVGERCSFVRNGVDAMLGPVRESVRDHMGEHEGIVVDAFEIEPTHLAFVGDDPSQDLCRLAVPGRRQYTKDPPGR